MSMSLCIFFFFQAEDGIRDGTVTGVQTCALPICIVPGGGVALARCVKALESLKLEGDEQIGVDIVKRAITEPLRQIAENAGEEGAIVIGKVHDSKDNNYGFNALTGDYEDLVKAGVLDPTKVVRTALTNAGSI